MSVETSPRSIGRDALVRRATVLNRLTIGWNAIEGIVAIAAGSDRRMKVGTPPFGKDIAWDFGSR